MRERPSTPRIRLRRKTGGHFPSDTERFRSVRTFPHRKSDRQRFHGRTDPQLLRSPVLDEFHPAEEGLSTTSAPLNLVPEVWRDYCLQFLDSALERTDGVTDADRALARETLVEALASTNATFAGTALRALHRGAPADLLVASNALRIARDPSYPSASRTTALLILEDCARATSSTPSTSSTSSTSSTPSTLAETAAAVSADPSASLSLRQTADAILKRLAPQSSKP